LQNDLQSNMWEFLKKILVLHKLLRVILNNPLKINLLILFTAFKIKKTDKCL